MRYLSVIILVFFFACDHASDRNEVLGRNEITIRDSLVPSRTYNNTDITNSKLIGLLTKPFDLHKFKKLKRGSNSSPALCKGLFKPDTIGMYYKFMFFDQHQLELRESQLFNKFTVLTYHFGKDQFLYEDTNEVLIGLRSMINDPDLGNADLVGKSKKLISTLYGSAFYETDSSMIYQYKCNVLSLFFISDKLKWYKYYKMAGKIKKDSIPERLINFDIL